MLVLSGTCFVLSEQFRVFPVGGLEGKGECVLDARIDLSLDKYAILQGDALSCDVSYGLRPIVGTIKAFEVCRRHVRLFVMLWSDCRAAFLTEMTGDVDCADLACALLHETVFWNWKLYFVNFFVDPFFTVTGHLLYTARRIVYRLLFN